VDQALKGYSVNSRCNWRPFSPVQVVACGRKREMASHKSILAALGMGTPCHGLQEYPAFQVAPRLFPKEIAKIKHHWNSQQADCQLFSLALQELHILHLASNPLLKANKCVDVGRALFQAASESWLTIPPHHCSGSHMGTRKKLLLFLIKVLFVHLPLPSTPSL
jgi:hypothetical protein